MRKELKKKERFEIIGNPSSRDAQIIDSAPQTSSFISFRYSSREISSIGGKTYLRAQEKSFENGKFKSEEFEGMAPENLYGNMVTDMQKMFFGQITSAMSVFSAFIPMLKKDKRD